MSERTKKNVRRQVKAAACHTSAGFYRYAQQRAGENCFIRAAAPLATPSARLLAGSPACSRAAAAQRQPNRPELCSEVR